MASPDIGPEYGGVGIGSGAGPGWRNPLRWPGACFAAERERWIPWVPVGIGLGAVCYFALPAEPPGWIGAVAASLLVLLSVLMRRRDGALLGPPCPAYSHPRFRRSSGADFPGGRSHAGAGGWSGASHRPCHRY